MPRVSSEFKLGALSSEFAKNTTEDGTFSFSCTLRASEANLVGMTLNLIPAVHSSTEMPALARQATPPGANPPAGRVSRTFTFTVNKSAYKPPRKLVMVCSWLLWLVSTASAAALVAYGVPWMRDAAQRSTAVGSSASAARLDRGAGFAYRTEASSNMDDKGPWPTKAPFANRFAIPKMEGLNPSVTAAKEAMKSAGTRIAKSHSDVVTMLHEVRAKTFEADGNGVSIALAGLPWQQAAATEVELSPGANGRFLRPLTTLFDQESLERCAAQSRRSLSNIEKQLSPLRTLPECPYVWSSAEELDGVAPWPVAIFGMTGAVAQVLGTCIEPRKVSGPLAQAIASSFSSVGSDAIAAAGGLAPSAIGATSTDLSISISSTTATTLQAPPQSVATACVRVPSTPLPLAECGQTDAGPLDVDRALLAARLAIATYRSCNSSPFGVDAVAIDEAVALEENTDHLREDLAKEGLELLGNIDGDPTIDRDINAYVAANATNIFVVFRGSCSLNNAVTDLMYHDDGSAAQALEEATGMQLPSGMYLHRGFVNAYLSVREQLMSIMSSEATSEPTARPVLVAGHSMGGAMAMLAALELEHQQQYYPSSAGFGRVTSLVFGAPRVGDSTFAELFGRIFWREDDHWALQAPNDAVPHLPFMSWGFRHPAGTILLQDEHNAPTPPPRFENDPGDTMEFLRPKEGDPMNWLHCHDLKVYIGLLDQIKAAGEESLQQCDVEDESAWGI